MVSQFKKETVKKSIVIPEGLSTRRDNNYLERLKPIMNQKTKQEESEARLGRMDTRDHLELNMRQMGKHFPTDSDWHKDKALDVYDSISSVDGIEITSTDWGVKEGNEDGKVLYWVRYSFNVLEMSQEVIDFLRDSRSKGWFQDKEPSETDHDTVLCCEIEVYLINASVEADKGFGFQNVIKAGDE